MSKKSKLSIKINFEKRIVKKKIHNVRPIHLLVDSTFFGKRETGQWGVVVFRDSIEKENLWWKFIDTEKLSHYSEGYELLSKIGYKILSTTCDGFRGLINVFNDKPVQFCHFHQKQIMRRYVTKNPRLIAGIELNELVEMLGKIPRDEFREYLEAYINYHKDFINEKTIDPITKKSFFTHRRLRSAIKSLLTNFSSLFIYEKYPKLSILITTNSLESHFSHIKDLSRIHRGLKREMKEKLVETILLNSSTVLKKS